MSRGTGVRATRNPVVVVAGEDGNDRRSLRILLEALCPQMRVRVVEISDSVRLRLATEANLADRVAVLARKARARAVRERADLACVFVHEDLDSVDGEGVAEIQARVCRALVTELGTAHYVLSISEMEAWLLLFPNSLETFVSSWNVPAKRQGKDTGSFGDPKKILTHEVSMGARRYRESDAPEIFEKIVNLGHIKTPSGSNRSWDLFCGDVECCCADHVRLAGKRTS
ncbi:MULTISPECIES: hypothetical protein [unclassified Frankia]|uniref:hypothetical protein n=1 Tax=unclassified Frankia TaxID=2632575 RepID=UPI002AD2B54A|nr:MULTISPECIES: hypothetical protein [unclassified Frankia]